MQPEYTKDLNEQKFIDIDQISKNSIFKKFLAKTALKKRLKANSNIIADDNTGTDLNKLPKQVTASEAHVEMVHSIARQIILNMRINLLEANARSHLESVPIHFEDNTSTNEHSNTLASDDDSVQINSSAAEDDALTETGIDSPPEYNLSGKLLAKCTNCHKKFEAKYGLGVHMRSCQIIEADNNLNLDISRPNTLSDETNLPEF